VSQPRTPASKSSIAVLSPRLESKTSPLDYDLEGPLGTVGVHQIEDQNQTVGQLGRGLFVARCNSFVNRTYASSDDGMMAVHKQIARYLVPTSGTETLPLHSSARLPAPGHVNIQAGSHHVRAKNRLPGSRLPNCHGVVLACEATLCRRQVSAVRAPGELRRPC